MRSKKHVFQNMDWLLFWLFTALVFAGWLNIYAASYSEEFESIFSFSQNYGKQVIWIGTSFILVLFIMSLDARLFSRLSYPLYGVLVLMLIGVLIFGTEIKGAKSWFTFGGFSIQPSEFAKFTTALALSYYLSGLRGKFSGIKSRLFSFAIIAIPPLLILLQPDTGSVLVYASFIFVLYREGLSGNVLLGGLALAALFILALLLKQTEISLPFDLVLRGKLILVLLIVGLGLAGYWLFKKIKGVKWLILALVVVSSGYIYTVDYVFSNVLQEHQQNRINELLGIVNDPRGAGYNVTQSKIAIGSGGMWGKGFLQGTQTKYNFVPEQSTDFIFCTVGEEWGFAGSLVVIALFLTMLIRILQITERQRSDFARIYGYCVASIFFFHFAINIGMTIGLAPVIGIPLPFFSYGGSSLWAFTILLFIFIKMDSERMHIL